MDDTQRTILIVEDEAPAAMALGDGLKAVGYTVFTASNGKEGLHAALEKHPDLILSDLKMPEMGGLEMIQELRKDSWGKNAKVVILTNLSDMESLQSAMEHETFHYLIKGDTSISKIMETVKSQIG